MMAIQILLLLQLIVILTSPISATYPIYGTKRYGRSPAGSRAETPSWPLPINYQQYVRSQRLPINYYDPYPYSQAYPDDYYYPQDTLSYPLYYTPRTSKYEVYQAVLPYYYNDHPFVRPGYGFYGYEGNDPIVDIEEEMLQEAERQQREDSQPIGHEMFYENEQPKPTDDNVDDVNAAFLQNLIMTQMYKDALDKHQNNGDYYTPLSTDAYGKWEEYAVEPKQNYYQEDEDVKELKQLATPRRQKQKSNEKKAPTKEDRMNLFQNKKNKNNNAHIDRAERENFWNWGDKRSFGTPYLADKKEEQSNHGPSIYAQAFLAFSDRKAFTKPSVPTTTSTPTVATTVAPKRDARGGQKEEVLMRPATPVRHPFSERILDMMHKEDNRKRTPSVYDKIKHMLDVEKSLEKDKAKQEIKPAMRKRIISSEDSLTHQLSVLKKAQ